MPKPTRQSVDLSGFPDLVMIMLGFRVRRWRGIATLLRIGKGLGEVRRDPPDGLLLDEPLFYSLNHIGMRQYWRDFDSLEAFTRSEPHAVWWRNFLKDSGGAGFWHETYRMRGGIEAVYVDMPAPLGLGRFAPPRQPIGPFLSAKARADAVKPALA
ncbi:MAG: DUF4188 domain-containing protein [Sphingomonas sp.]|uniref:DUF4188 domain-containing protein n=1 Tax=Sphingomonas sp. TaxID=28214 RepID=UPI001AC19E39|nr:DUF4188 domain-containing protein [Sphingomonas sp.]MBN8808775.1 DUF4188 domain-containing protein [Sphingomonas sp.]